MDKSKVQELMKSQLDVSRETIQRLEIYESLILKWNPHINLVSNSTIEQLWHRHFLDSMQILKWVKPDRNWIDLGSGGGFPGLILAMADDSCAFTLVESDQRKSVFLRNVSRETGLKTEIISERIEKLETQDYQHISARALASLDKLLGYAKRLGKQDSKYIFPKGKNWEIELTEANKTWQYHSEVYDSMTDPFAKIIVIDQLTERKK